MKGKLFQWMKFLLDILQIQENWTGRYFITTSRVYSLLNTQAKMQTEINNPRQPLTDGGFLADRNSANHPYCFLSNQKKVQILAFLHVLCERNAPCPPPEKRLQRWRVRAWSQASLWLRQTANVNLYHVTKFFLNCRLLFITSTQK